MKHLFYFNTCFNGSFFGMLVDEAIELAKNKSNDVLFVYCGTLNEMCIQNASGSKKLCQFCSKSTKRVLDQYKIKNQPLTDFIKPDHKYSFVYKNIKDVRKITYRDINIGLGFMSSFVTRTRNLNPLVDDSSRNYFDAHLNQLGRTVDALYNIIDTFHPDTIHSFNGRFEEFRTIYDVCQAKKIKCLLYEGFKKGDRWEKVIFEDHLPHDIKYWGERRDYSWDHLEMTEEEKIKLGESFYYRRRNGVYAGDKIYVKDQVAGKIPNIDKAKINIGIMNSSEDEYAAVGAEWDALKFFPTQYDGTIYMLEHADKNIHFYLRVHPNLKSIKYKYHTDLYDLEKKYNNVTVIPADSDISTYTLLDNMDKIVCFGSTIGVESAFWKKPTINLGPALYSLDRICYVPKDNEELIKMLSEPLEPLFNDSIYKYGAYTMNKDPMIVTQKHVDYQTSDKKFFGYTYHIYNFINFLISRNITALYISLGRFIWSKKNFCKYEIPLKEE